MSIGGMASVLWASLVVPCCLHFSHMLVICWSYVGVNYMTCPIVQQALLKSVVPYLKNDYMQMLIVILQSILSCCISDIKVPVLMIFFQILHTNVLII